MYNHKALALVLNVRNNIPQLTKELIEFFKKIETDDKLYLLNKHGISFDKRGGAISCLSAYDFKNNPPLHLLLKDALDVLDLEYYDLTRIIYVITDEKDVDGFQLKKMFNKAEQGRCKLCVYEVQEHNFESLVENYTNLNNFENLSDVLIESYKND